MSSFIILLVTGNAHSSYDGGMWYCCCCSFSTAVIIKSIHIHDILIVKLVAGKETFFRVVLRPRRSVIEWEKILDGKRKKFLFFFGVNWGKWIRFWNGVRACAWFSGLHTFYSFNLMFVNVWALKRNLFSLLTFLQPPTINFKIFWNSNRPLLQISML